jgi:hypothetical protein
MKGSETYTVISSAGLDGGDSRHCLSRGLAQPRPLTYPE